MDWTRVPTRSVYLFENVMKFLEELIDLHPQNNRLRVTSGPKVYITTVSTPLFFPLEKRADNGKT